MALESRISGVAKAGFWMAVVFGAAAVAAGLGTRFDIWNFRVGLSILKYAAYGGVAAAFFSFISLLTTVRLMFKRGFAYALFGLLIGCALFVIPWHMMETARKLPAIHDITTDTENPPQFVAILPLRKNASNPAGYGGPVIAEQQRKAYPDIVPLILNIPRDAALERAVSVGRELGWRIVDANRASGRIEAVDTTFWFGFKDDIVIRIEGSDSVSRVDIRSVSRVGVSDIGKNAERIRKFLALMKKPS